MLRRSAGGCTTKLGAAGTRGTMWKTASASPPSGGRPRLVADHTHKEPCTKTAGRGPVPFYPSPSRGVRFIYLRPQRAAHGTHTRTHVSRASSKDKKHKCRASVCHASSTLNPAQRSHGRGSDEFWTSIRSVSGPHATDNTAHRVTPSSPPAWPWPCHRRTPHRGRGCAPRSVRGVYTRQTP